MSVFNLNATDHLSAKLFFDDNGGLSIARYDSTKYGDIARDTKQQRGFFWLPEEVDLNTDRGDFQKLTPHEKHIFTSNLKRQILLDSVQGRAPIQTFGRITALPEMESWIIWWTAFEQIHSESYTHIIRQVYPNPSETFNTLTDIPEIVECAKDVSRYYDDFLDACDAYHFLGEGTHTVNGKKVVVDMYELKKKLWLCMMSVNVLEGIRFYVSFACSWAFAENKRMEGNAKIIKFIARDENLHLATTQKLLKHTLLKDDPDYARIKAETEEECYRIFESAVEQEKAWAHYLFKDGSIIGLNESLLADYVDWIADKRLRALGMTPRFKSQSSNPLPWTQSWIGSKSVQVAPQETEISSYVVGGVKQDVEDNDFGGFTL
jgi:ribonucleoside-diphosphate reductase beta chain